MAATVTKRDEKKAAAVTVVTETAPPIDPSSHDPALLAAWRRFLDYDIASSNQKELHQRIRRWIIVLGLLTSAGAVISIYAGNLPFASDLIRQPLRILLIIMPIASVALMNYAAQFSTSTGWVEYRVSAEMIRSQIYLYRMNIPPYRGLDTYEKRAKMLEEVAGIDDWMRKHNLPMPQMQNLDDVRVLAKVDDKTEGENDDGFCPVNMEQYLDWRIDYQINWYTDKIDRDYRTMRQNRLLALGVASVGSVLAGIGSGLEGLVGITTAMGVALTTYSDVQMYGRTYRLYHEAAFDLKQLLNRWHTLRPPERETLSDEFVINFEKVFDTERRRWREDTIRAQISTEQAIYSQVQQVAGSQADNLLQQEDAQNAILDRPALFATGEMPAIQQTKVKVEKSDGSTMEAKQTTIEPTPGKSVDEAVDAADAVVDVVDAAVNDTAVTAVNIYPPPETLPPESLPELDADDLNRTPRTKPDA